MSTDLTYKTSVGIQGCVGVCYIGEKIYATSYTNNLLYIIDWNGTNASSTTYNLSGVCSNPHMITTDGINVYISGATSNNIVLYNPSSASTTVISNVDHPTGLCINGGYLYASLWSQNKIIKIDLSNTNNRVDVANVTRPQGIIYNNNTFYVGSFTDNKVYSYNNNWDSGSKSTFVNINQPTGISYFSNYIFVSSNANGNVTQYDLNGATIVSNFVSGMTNPYQMIFNTSYISSKVYALASYGNNQLYMYTFNNITCFNEGTKILCLNKNFEEEYIPIEKLRKGDLVKCYRHGYRKINLIGKNKMINDPDRFNECMYKMIKTEDNGLIEDLIVTGGHSILVNDLGHYKEENEKYFGGETQMIDDKYLLLASISKDFKKIEDTAIYTYYHFILENNGDDEERFGVWANGVLTETPSKVYFKQRNFNLL